MCVSDGEWRVDNKILEGKPTSLCLPDEERRVDTRILDGKPVFCLMKR